MNERDGYGCARCGNVKNSLKNVELREPETQEFMQLNVNVFQTQYSKNFYNDVIKSGEYSKLAYVGNQLAGGVGVRIQLNTK